MANYCGRKSGSILIIFGDVYFVQLQMYQTSEEMNPSLNVSTSIHYW